MSGFILHVVSFSPNGAGNFVTATGRVFLPGLKKANYNKSKEKTIS
jgi:hypothetical protein